MAVNSKEGLLIGVSFVSESELSIKMYKISVYPAVIYI
jgi:hypothetical protein